MAENNKLGKYIIEASHQLKLSLNAAFGHTDLNGLQARILGFVEYNDYLGKDVYQKDIEAEFKIRRSSVSSVLDTMEKNGYVRRVSVLSDARLKKLVLTEKAKTTGIQYRNNLDEFEAILEEGLSPEEISVFKTVRAKVVENAIKLKNEKKD